VPALAVIGRMVQHILPKGFHRIRYFGLQTTCKAKKVRAVLKQILIAMGRTIKGAYRIVAPKTYRERVWASTGRDPLRCGRRDAGDRREESAHRALSAPPHGSDGWHETGDW
jgi:Putative transposase